MPGRLIAVGDIHGCSQAFRVLLDAISPSADDHWVLLGDFIDRGPDSKGVIDAILDLEKACETSAILGNHEEMMWMVLTGRAGPADWLRYGGVETLDSYGFSGDMNVIPDAHRAFLCRCLDYLETDRHFFVHANYEESTPLAELDAEVLRWRSLSMYLPGPHRNGKQAIVGHTADRFGEILDVGHLKCIDTYCYGGQWLTALDVISGEIWQANQAGELRLND